MDLFSLAAQLTLDTSSFDSSLSKAQSALDGLVNGSKISSQGSRVSSILGGIANTADRVVSSVFSLGQNAMDFGWGLIETSAAVRANQAAFADTFAESADEARATFDTISKETNILSRFLQEQGTLGFTQFRAAGMETNDALSSMEKFLRLAADGAARYDISIDKAAQKVLSFTRGNVAGGREIGLVTSATDRNTKALELYEKKWAELTAAERQHVMLDIAQQMYDASNTTGQAAREMGQFGVAYNNFSKTWEGAQALMGGALSEKMIPVLDKITETMQTNPDLFIAFGSTLGDLFSVGADVFLETMEFAVAHKDDIIGMVRSIGDMITGNWWGRGAEEQLTPLQRAMDYVTGKDISFDNLATALGGNQQAVGFVDALNAWLEKNPDVAREDIPVEVVAQWVPDAPAQLQQQASGWEVLVNAVPVAAHTIDSFLSMWGSDKATPHARGLDYVPHDGYLASLHRGESILNRVEAEEWRAVKSNGALEHGTGVTREELLDVLSHLSVTMDGRTVGTLVTPYVSREQAAEAWRRR